MSDKKWVIIFAIVNILVVAGVIVWIINRDSQGPVIEGPADGIYEPGMTDEELLDGITATDYEDGDVSQSLIIEKITVNENKKVATIVCGAMDFSGNITKKSFRRTANIESSLEEASSESVFSLEAGEAANGEEAATEEATMEEVTSEEAVTEEMTTEEITTEAETETEAQDREEPQPEEASEPKKPATGAPSISFSKAEVKTKVGMTPAWVTVIGRLTDDTSTYEDLLGTIAIHGEYKVDTVGEYNVTVTVKDKDGNESAPAPMKIIVEG